MSLAESVSCAIPVETVAVFPHLLSYLSTSLAVVELPVVSGLQNQSLMTGKLVVSAAHPARHSG